MSIHPLFSAALGSRWRWPALAAIVLLSLSQIVWSAPIHEGDGKTYIVDQKGEHWEVTQAMDLGFRPEEFQFGIGRDAIRPLDDAYLGSEGQTLPGEARVIGVKNATAAHAYSVRRLTRHEIANTRLGDTPIAAAY
jgi:hypothetical protein